MFAGFKIEGRDVVSVFFANHLGIHEEAWEEVKFAVQWKDGVYGAPTI